MENEYEYERAKVFFERKTIVHVSTKQGFFFNGIILEVAESFFVLKDRFDGKEKFIYFSELKKSLEPFKEEGK